MNHLKKLQWDTDFFKKSIYRLDLNSEAELNNLDQAVPTDSCTYIFSSDRIESLTPILFDEKVTFKKNVKDIEVQETTGNVKCFLLMNPAEVSFDILNELSIISSASSRFRNDKSFASEDVDQLYHLWIKKAYADQQNHFIFIATIDQKIAGMYSCKRQEQSLIIELVATLPQYQKQGVGSALMTTVMNYAREKDFENDFVTTQLGNEGACRLYTKHGFAQSSLLYTYHFHK
jgi:GNAT superfamily N-acetyltransferase